MKSQKLADTILLWTASWQRKHVICQNHVEERLLGRQQCKTTTVTWIALLCLAYSTSCWTSSALIFSVDKRSEGRKRQVLIVWSQNAVAYQCLNMGYTALIGPLQTSRSDRCPKVVLANYSFPTYLCSPCAICDHRILMQISPVAR